MTDTPDFANPPLVELVLGVQFSPLTKLTAGHFGLFWKELASDWTDPADGLLLGDQFELFERPQWTAPVGLQLRLESAPLPGRFLLGHASGDRLLQLQATRFHLNWRKRGEFYPSYKRLVSEFEDMWSCFTAFAEKTSLGKLVLNQWELTYIDAFPKDEYWRTPADWSDFLPALFSKLFPTDSLDIVLEHRAAEWSYEIQPKRGRLHISAQSGRSQGDKRDALLLQMTARGPIGKGGAETLRTGLDWGHDAVVGVFLRVTSDEAKKRWGLKR